MAPFIRALTYASLFIGLILVFLPARLLSWSGVTRPDVGVAQLLGAGVAVAGGLLALWCVLAFATVGKGTPAPFDPPRKLVVRGPYAFVRNPMYIGAGMALAGAAVFFGSWVLLGYAALFLLIAHVFVFSYEEPTLRRTFGAEFESYCQRVRRWRPRISPYRS